LATLEDTLRKLAAKGDLVHVSLVSSGGTFDARVCRARVNGYSQAIDLDPVVALTNALTLFPVPPDGFTRPPSDHELIAERARVTAAVTDLPADWTKP